jgi:TRAP-type C4-dicarboxylate transport system substrate-binding protein
MGRSWLFVVLWPIALGAEPKHVLRFATVAPDGSAWAREFKAFARDIELGTNGEVRVKWYLDAIAGDEVEQRDRIERGQLDGAGFGILCERLSPTLRVTRLPGIFQDLDEAAAVINSMQRQLEEEAHQSGYTLLANTGLGPDLVLSKTPVHDLEDLKKLKLWRWDLDEVGIATSTQMGLHIVATPVSDAAAALDQKKIDGFIGIPAAFVAFQWSARASYLLDLRYNYLWGCLVVTDRALATLSTEQRTVVRDAGARLQQRYQEISRRMDEALLGGAFQKQGVHVEPPGPAFRAEYFAASRAAREKIAPKFVKKEIVDRVLQMLADYRAEHRR